VRVTVDYRRADYLFSRLSVPNGARHKEVATELESEKGNARTDISTSSEKHKLMNGY